MNKYDFDSDKKFIGKNNNLKSSNNQTNTHRTVTSPPTVPRPPMVKPLGQADNTNKPKKLSLIKLSGHWGIKSVLCMIACVVLTYLSLHNISGGNILGLFGEAGIKPNMPLEISGYTISEINNIQFTVDNKSAKDVSDSTVWYLNGVQINSGTNSTYVNINDLNWGDNSVKAVNNEDTIEYKLVVERGVSDTDQLHTMLSMSTKYSDGWYETGETFETVDKDTMTSLVKQKYNCIDYGNGYVKTSQEYKNGLITLETTETEVYSLSLGYPLQLPKEFAGDYAVYVTGNWDAVDSATISFDLKGESKDSFTAVTYKNNKVVKISNDKQYYSNGRIIIDVNSSGIYMLRRSDIESGNLHIRYDIAILDLAESDVINTDKLAAEPKLSPGDKSKKLNTEYYDSLVGNLIDSAEEMTKVKIEPNILTWGNKTAMLDKNGSTYIRDYTESSVEEALLTLFDSEKDSIYQKLGLMLIDASELSNNQIKELAKLISKVSGYDIYSMKFIVVGSKIDNIRSLVEMPDDTIIYELDTMNEANSILEGINSWLSAGSNQMLSTIDESGNTIENKVITLADSLFSVETDGLSINTSISPYTSTGNSYGQALLAKLAFNSEFNSSFVSSTDCIRDKSALPDGIEISFPSVGVVLKSEDIESINSGGINRMDSELITNIANMLDISQYNYNGGLFNSFSTIQQDNGYTNIVEKLVDKINEEGPILATVGSNFGDMTVLITAISQDATDNSIFYLHLYNPLKPGIEEVAKLIMHRGVSTSNSIGYGYTFEYKCNGFILDKINLIDRISIYSDGEEIYNK